MNLYLISQDYNDGYDTYDSAVVAAENKSEATKISPDNYREWSDEKHCWLFLYSDGMREPDKHGTWVDDLDHISVELIGKAALKTKPGLIMASFNAG